MRKLSIATVRIVAGILAMPAFAVLANRLGDYRWFWPYDRQVEGLVAAVVAVVLGFLTPSFARMSAYNELKRRRALKEMEARLQSKDPP